MLLCAARFARRTARFQGNRYRRQAGDQERHLRLKRRPEAQKNLLCSGVVVA
jgi:hypothetical protein